MYVKFDYSICELCVCWALFIIKRDNWEWKHEKRARSMIHSKNLWRWNFCDVRSPPSMIDSSLVSVNIINQNSALHGLAHFFSSSHCAKPNELSKIAFRTGVRRDFPSSRLCSTHDGTQKKWSEPWHGPDIAEKQTSSERYFIFKSHSCAPLSPTSGECSTFCYTRKKKFATKNMKKKVEWNHQTMTISIDLNATQCL